MVHIDEQDVTQKEEDYSYLELGLPKYLQESLNNYKIALEFLRNN